MWNLFSLLKMLPFLFLCTIAAVRAQFEVPDASVEVLRPRGFKVSIPDVPGIKLFAFHGKINEEFDGREAGTFARDILKPKNGSWTFVDKITKLKPGDILYFWTYVDFDDGERVLGYPKDDQMFVVKGQDINKTPVRDPIKPTETGNLFFDDFSSNSLNPARWIVEQKFAGEPDYEFVMYVNRPETIQIKNNKLKINPVLTQRVFGEGFLTSFSGYDFGENCTADASDTLGCRRSYNGGFLLPPVVSAQISTKNKFSFKYGKVEIRAKLPAGDWIYPEIYLNPLHSVYGHSNYESGQIRIAFSPGNSDQNKLLQGGVVLGQSNAARDYGIKKVEAFENWSDDFHKFVVNWQPNEITLSVDDRMYGRITPPSNGFAELANNLRINNADKWGTGSKIAPFDQEMYLVLGVGVGGFNFKDSHDKPWRNGKRNMLTQFNNAQDEWLPSWSEKSALQVDYIKVTKN
ncbi:unnamed protein product [Phyllotreta striolata]|uniref:Glycoside hydrolase family 16 n=1 Tax=Phyllotreta striolata TaxID=444603 RepID=A0A9N9TD84_PHYSR|nr:unnamed protein product [Phyllotreta striolata]